MGQGRWRERELGELEARVHADGVAQLLPEDTLLAVVGQLEQVEAGGGGGQTATRLPLADGEEAPEDTAQGVPRVLKAHTKPWLRGTQRGSLVGAGAGDPGEDLASPQD